MSLVRINILSIIASLAGIILLCGCSEDIWAPENDSRDGATVILTAKYPSFSGESGMSRAETISEKTSFQEGDILHVSAEFAIQETATTTTTEIIYNCFKYGNGQWQPVNTAEAMKWPWNAVSGKFKAYYMPTSGGSIGTGAANAFSARLAGTYSESDPLYAETGEVPYGHTVNFTFNHLCTRIVFTEVTSGYVDKFGLRTKTSTSGGTDVAGEQANAYMLTHNEDNTLDFKFLQQPNLDGGMSVVSSADARRVLVFYLQPGNYSKAEVCYTNNRPYIELNIDGLSECKPGYSYEVNVSHTPGVIKKEDDDPWVEPGKDDLSFDIDIEAFLKSIEEGKTYSQNDPTTGKPVQITRYDDLGHIELLYNLDFRNETFTPKTLPSTCYLHGNYHCIKNLVQPLFENLNGKLDNIEIRDVNIKEPSSDGQIDVGALCMRSSGNVNNVRLNNCSITAYAQKESNLLLCAGALVGEQVTGAIDEVMLMGKIEIKVVNEFENGVPVSSCDATVDLGGVVGQVSGVLSNIFMSADDNGNAPTLCVVNETRGKGLVSTGGLAGILAGSGVISDCIISCEVNASSCNAQQNCVGGMIGRMRGGDMKDCTVSGTVLGGITESPGEATLWGYSLTGGVCGYYVDYPKVENCYVFCTVEEHSYEPSGRILYATGGGVGFIDPKELYIHNCRVIGTVKGNENSTGSFVGGIRNAAAAELQGSGNQATDTNNHNFCGNV